jgi:hypothetical protein
MKICQVRALSHTVQGVRVTLLGRQRNYGSHNRNPPEEVNGHFCCHIAIFVKEIRKIDRLTIDILKCCVTPI